MPILTSKEKSLLNKKKLYKILSENEIHNNFQYKEGLNIDSVKFNPEGSCEPGGLYFSDVEHILGFIEYGPFIREVTIPQRVQVYKDPEGNKYKAHKIILGSRREWKDCIEDLIKEGADIHADNDSSLRYASENGHVEVVKILLDNGADVHACNDSSLRWASENGHVEVVELLEAAKGNKNGNS